MLRRRAMEIFHDNMRERVNALQEFGKATQTLPQPEMPTRKRLALLPPGVNDAT